MAEHCEAPITIERQGRPVLAPEPAHWGGDGILRTPGHGTRIDGTQALFLDMEVPCRRCGACLRNRAYHWRMRAISEISGSARTWFTTLTVNDHEQYVATCRASERCRRSGVRFEDLDWKEQLRLRVRAFSPALTGYWKRVRKNSGAPLRFLWVAEVASQGVRAHCGNPHFHALIHERSPDKPVRKAVLREAWKLGFSTHKLVEDERAANYLTKYIAKDLCFGLRSSHRYGKQVEGDLISQEAKAREEKLNLLNEKKLREHLLSLKFQEPA